MDRIQVQLLMDRIQMRACVDCIQMHQQSRGDTVLLLLVSGAMLLPIYIRPIYHAHASCIFLRSVLCRFSILSD